MTWQLSAAPSLTSDTAAFQAGTPPDQSSAVSIWANVQTAGWNKLNTLVSDNANVAFSSGDGETDIPERVGQETYPGFVETAEIEYNIAGQS